MSKQASIEDKPKEIGVFGYLCAIIAALLVLVLMQYKYWYGDYGRSSLIELQEKVQEQDRMNAEQSYVNQVLLADVQDLKTGAFAIEEHARLDLGLIKPDEVFIQLSNAQVAYSERQPSSPETFEVESVDALPEVEVDADSQANQTN